MAEPGKVEGVDDADIAGATSALLRIPDTSADDCERFAIAVRGLVERRAQGGWPNEADTYDVAAFVLVDRPREYQPQFASAPITDPKSTAHPLLGRVLLLTRDGTHGQVFQMPCSPDALPDWLTDAGLGNSTLILAYRPTLTLSIRPCGIDGGITREECIREVPPAVTIDELREALKSFRLKQILTPAFCELGVWQHKRAASYVPDVAPERAIQRGLGRWLNSWFHGILHADREKSTIMGRIDVTLMVEDGGKMVNWAILELKVIKSFANAQGTAKAAPIARTTNVEAIVKGLLQAHAFGLNSKVAHGLLEVYDMRKEKSEDLFADPSVEELLKTLSPKPKFAVHAMYGSADDARFAGEIGV